MSLTTQDPNATVQAFVEEILIDRRLDRLDRYFDKGRLIQHNPRMEDGLPALREALEAVDGDRPRIRYDRVHRVLAQGDFVLSVSEGFIDGVHSALYDLFRVSEGKLVEHWDTIETVPPRSEWKNANGKF